MAVEMVKLLQVHAFRVLVILQARVACEGLINALIHPPMFEAAFQLDPNGSDFGKDKSLKFLQLWIYRRPGGVLDICVYMFELYRPKFSWKNFRSIQMVKTEEQMEYKYGEACFCFCF
ncbi:uncharacterized protein LOC133744448 [Rosa rugosa]|uniref:uncharacterized protein LOC133744448 n=1 Tax=Rosa rugosa TaxID=74645 RepID=UPI002B40AD70|nr:uncharacterized protein LOC133744448 [Rosa rugosa]